MGSGASKSRQKKYLKEAGEVWQAVQSSSERGGKRQLGQGVVIRRSGWKTVRLFVSSTFKDFHSERELLVKAVFPDLRVWADGRRIHLVDCDLRWGIPQDSASEEVLKTCLGEIDRCYQDNVQPFFLNMTSERIGWVPAATEISEGLAANYGWVPGLSMTEMEILHAAYRKDNPNALFMLRDKGFIKSVPYEHRSIFVDGNPKAQSKLARLKAEIMRRFPREQVGSYSASFGGVDAETNVVQIQGLRAFGEAVFHFFKARIEDQYPLIHDDDEDPITAKQTLHEAFMQLRASTVIGRSELAASVVAALSAEGGGDGVCVIGEPGLGKTSFVARLGADLQLAIAQKKLQRPEYGEWSLFVHFVGSCPGSTSLDDLLRRLAAHLGVLSDGVDVETLSQGVHAALASKDVRPTFILIDAVNQARFYSIPILDYKHGVFPLDVAEAWGWVPSSVSACVRWLVSAVPDSPALRALQRRRPNLTPPFHLQPLDRPSREEMVSSWLGEFNKQLNAEQMELLLSKRGSENPLWLSIACEELRVFGLFRQLREKIQGLADELIALEMQLLSRLEGESSRALIAGTLCLLEASHSGLLETELRDLLGFNRAALSPPTEAGSSSSSGTRSTSIGDANSRQGWGSPKSNAASDMSMTSPLNAFEWAVVFRHLRAFLRPFGSSGEGRLDFYHRSFSKAVRRKYFTDDAGGARRDVYDWWHAKLADYFCVCGNPERRAEEYPYALAQGGQWAELSVALCEWDVFEEMYDEDHSAALLGYWKQISADFEGMGSAYTEALKRLRDEPDAEMRVVADRYLKVVNALYGLGRTEAGQFSAASGLLEDAQSLEVDVLGARPEQMVQIHFLFGHVQDRVMSLQSFMYRSQLPFIKRIIEHFGRSLDIRRTLSDGGLEQKRQLVRTLSRTAFYYSGWALRGGDEELQSKAAQSQAVDFASEAIQVAQQIGDAALEADSLITRGVTYGRACLEQVEDYLSAEGLLLKHKGPLFFNLGRLYLNLGIYYEEISQYETAYDYFLRWNELMVALYGSGHDQAQRSRRTLDEPMYRRIATNRAVTKLPRPSLAHSENVDVISEKLVIQSGQSPTPVG